MDLRTAKTLTPREYHARRAAERREAREALREHKLREARALERELGMPVDLRPLRGAVADAVRDGGEKVYG